MQMAAAAAFVKPPLEIVLQLSTDRGRGTSVALKSTTGSATQPGAQKVVLLLNDAALTCSAHTMQRSSKATARQRSQAALTGNAHRQHSHEAALTGSAHMQHSHEAALTCSAHTRQCSHAALTQGNRHRMTRSTCCNCSDVYIMSN